MSSLQWKQRCPNPPVQKTNSVESTLPSIPNCQKGSNWEVPHMRKHNTFLELSPPQVATPQGFFMMRRQTSDGALSRLSGSQEDYDPLCRRLNEHGSAPFLEEMKTAAKLDTRAGGAVVQQDKKGQERQERQDREDDYYDIPPHEPMEPPDCSSLRSNKMTAAAKRATGAAGAVMQRDKRIQELRRAVPVPVPGPITRWEARSSSALSRELRGHVSLVPAQPGNYPALVSAILDQGFDPDYVLTRVPVNANGELTSIGSSGHFQKKCSPCAFFSSTSSSGGPCHNGIFCGYCHFEHSTKVRIRPCKGKRERYKKLRDILAKQIQERPFTFDLSIVHYPPSIAQDDLLKNKMTSYLVQLIEQERLRQTEMDGGLPYDA